VFCISTASASEFRNLLSGLTSQGIAEPEILSVPLPITSIGSGTSTLNNDPKTKMFLVVGSHEPRKNHEMILASAEYLWQSGNDFELHFAGSRGWKSDFFWNMYDDLKKRGRPVHSHIGIDDVALQKLYASSGAVISVSHHEGYGLPIAEAIGFEKPVITVNWGSQGELAKVYSLATIDTLDVLELAGQMADFISSENSKAESPRETDQTKANYPLSWKEYAESIWKHLQDS
jgi:glycosyltransferase involved in cell wall biosynthesis